MQPAPPNSGPAVVPSGNPGLSSDAIASVQLALEQMQKALPGIPIGTDLHRSLMDAVRKVGSNLQEFQATPQMQMQQLMKQAADMRAAAPNNALAALAGGGAPPPALPPPGGMPAPGLGAPPLPAGGPAVPPLPI